MHPLQRVYINSDYSSFRETIAIIPQAFRTADVVRTLESTNIENTELFSCTFISSAVDSVEVWLTAANLTTSAAGNGIGS